MRNRDWPSGTTEATAPVLRHGSSATTRRSRPSTHAATFLGLGQGVAWEKYHGRGERTGHLEDTRSTWRLRVACFDIYRRPRQPRREGRLWYVPRGVRRLREWCQDGKPVWSISNRHHRGRLRQTDPAAVRR